MRPNVHDYYVSLLPLVAARSTCARRAVAAIITDAKGRVLATGYNGVPAGAPHCMERDDEGGTICDVDNPATGIVPCAGAKDPPGDTRRCLAVHAEANALLQCVHVLSQAHTLYCSTTPCLECAKLIANTPIQLIFVQEEYVSQEGAELLRSLGRTVKTWA